MGVSDVDITGNRDIPDHPWPYRREKFEIVGVKNDSECVSLSVFLY